MSEEYKDDVLDSDDKDDSKKKRNIIIAVIVLIILALLGVFLMFSRDKEDADKDESLTPETSTSSQVVEPEEGEPTSSEAPRSSQPQTSDEEKTPSSPSAAPQQESFKPQPQPRSHPEPKTPLPTKPPKEKIEAHMLPIDPNSGDPGTLSEYFVVEMFNIKPYEDKGFRERFGKVIKDRGSKVMKRTGFKPWWPASEPEHDPYFATLMLKDDGSQMFTQIEKISQDRIANDMVQYHYRVYPVMIDGNGGRLNMADFEIKVIMIGDEKGTWLVEDYYFPDGRVPPLH